MLFGLMRSSRCFPNEQLANAMTAFLLNVAAVWLVGVGGGLVLTLAGVFKVSHGFNSLGYQFHFIILFISVSHFFICVLWSLEDRY